MILGVSRDAQIDLLNLSTPLKKLTKGEYVHDELEFRCLRLKYSLEPDNFSPINLDFIPLWESESSITGFYLDDDNHVFIHYSIDNINELKEIGTSVIELVEYLVHEYVDYEYENEVRKMLLAR